MRSTSCGSSRTASIPRCWSISASPRRSRASPQRSSIKVDLLELPTERLNASAETVGYYVVAEAIANAQKHSDASLVEVRASVSRGTLRVEISDNGAGGAVERPGSGLEGLRDRAEAMGGTMQLDSPLGGGTRVVVEIPVSSA